MWRVRDRDVTRIVTAPLQRRHWSALRSAFRVFDHPVRMLARYLTNGGTYPWSPTVRTPAGRVQITLYSYHDLLTVNEIFCRGDYGTGAPRVVMDIGANRGLAALFFLTRRPDCIVHCFEPDPANVVLLRETLLGYESRYVLVERAVTAASAESVLFVPAGRYGRLAGDSDACAVELPAVGIDAALESVVDRERRVDLIKIDTEGSENALVDALRNSPLACSVDRVVYEDNAGRTRWLSLCNNGDEKVAGSS